VLDPYGKLPRAKRRQRTSMTQRNPYAPPVTVPARVRSAVLNRPLAAWLLLALLAFVAVSMLAAVWRLAWMVALSLDQIRDPAALVAAILWRIGLIAVVAAAIINVHRGKPLGRWLGLVAIIVLAAWSVFRSNDAQYPNDAQRAGASLGQHLVLPILFAWWAYAFAFSAKAKRFFSRQPLDTV
jgi:hypothetical protein